MKLVDTNVFLRHVAEPGSSEDALQQAACEAFFRRCRESGESIVTTEACLAEICYVLASKRQYGMPGQRVAELVRALLVQWQVHIVCSDLHVAAIDVLAAHPVLGFEDALLAAHALDRDIELVSYDRDFDRVPGVRRVEP
jgi:predicted nucleic acid-binding protein